MANPTTTDEDKLQDRDVIEINTSEDGRSIGLKRKYKDDTDARPSMSTFHPPRPAPKKLKQKVAKAPVSTSLAPLDAQLLRNAQVDPLYYFPLHLPGSGN